MASKAKARTREFEQLAWETNQAPHRWDVTHPEIYAEDRWQEVFAEMRAKAPINKIIGSDFGDYWNITTHKVIQHVEALPDIYSSSFEHGGITILPSESDDDSGVERVIMPMFNVSSCRCLSRWTGPSIPKSAVLLRPLSHRAKWSG